MPAGKNASSTTRKGPTITMPPSTALRRTALHLVDGYLATQPAFIAATIWAWAPWSSNTASPMHWLPWITPFTQLTLRELVIFSVKNEPSPAVSLGLLAQYQKFITALP